MNLARQIQELLHSKIPISVRVEDYDGRRLVLSAPLAENVNHLGTAFGGCRVGSRRVSDMTEGSTQQRREKR
ncbi:MAG: thioesterase domain-containing protein [Acidobacteria bacterium]|nr:thioesterase domain-containing protein [Acidobacteriota bacterium]